MFQLCKGTRNGYTPFEDTEFEDVALGSSVWKEIKGLSNTLSVNTLIDYLSAQDIFQLSLSSKEVQKYLDNGVYNWEQRIFREFHLMPMPDEKSFGYRDYLKQYEIWKASQSLLRDEVKSRDNVIRMLKFSVSMSRFLYVYDTWIVCIGAPMTIMVFTILMMLHLMNIIHIPVTFIYSIFYVYFLLLFPCVSLPGFYLRANSKKEITPMWFLSFFNANFIFSLIKRDYVTRVLKEPRSSVKYISNNEIVDTKNRLYFYSLLQVLIVYFFLLLVLILFNLIQTPPHVSFYFAILAVWLLMIAYGIVMTLKFIFVESLKGDTKYEIVIYSFIVFQWGLFTAHFVRGWPNLFFTLLPSIIIIGCYVVILVAYLIGLCGIDAHHIIKKRGQIAVLVIASLSFLFFLIHLSDKFSDGKTVPSIVLCIEFVIPEICFVLAITFYLIRVHKGRSPVLDFQNSELFFSSSYVRSLVTTNFTLRSRLQQLCQTEPRLLRYVIITQLFKSFIQHPEIPDSPYFPMIMELIDELKRSAQPDVIHAVQLLQQTGVSFTPLLQTLIRELLAESEVRVEIPVPVLHDGSVRGVPAVNPAASVMIHQQSSVELEEGLYSLLEEASVEEQYNTL